MADRTAPRARPDRKAPAAAAAKPKRTKKTLGDDFLDAVRADFRAHGAGVIAAVRADKPDQYLKIVQSVLPKDLAKDLHVSSDNLEALSDDEIRRRIRGLEAVLGPFGDQPEGAPPLSGAAAGAGPQAQD
ncbi:hypothetical protein X769_23900 [Mesorhizobium sp. LSJC268A00]|uniref:hypothetical protein n=1 Tax=unclassified Mesorhizobium TaxID=325217 RepID=UPI0003CF37EC|nr:MULTISPECIES: hypothetical protein [unclassified Mesorhizobium]ESW98967.1 hypothetical protein X769_23900 [Mesorhizobium sp. LSJC268A00]ESZ61374.1 hypothetical protein X728_14230 [Mesorhizobium sp. L103C120A0]WJI43448.1 hypothetical protein NL532_22805 [Mesorhizobium sp. C120A]